MKGRFNKTYKLVDLNGRTLGEYTTIDGCHAAAARRNITEYEIEFI